MVSGLEGLLEIVGLEVTTEGIRTSTHPESCRENVTDFRGCNSMLDILSWQSND